MIRSVNDEALRSGLMRRGMVTCYLVSKRRHRLRIPLPTDLDYPSHLAEAMDREADDGMFLGPTDVAVCVAALRKVV